MHSGRTGRRRCHSLGPRRSTNIDLEQLVLNANGAPLPLRCNSRVIDLQPERPIDGDEAIDVDVGSTNPHARCNIRAIDRLLERPIGVVVAIEGDEGAPLPQIRCY